MNVLPVATDVSTRSSSAHGIAATVPLGRWRPGRRRRRLLQAAADVLFDGLIADRSDVDLQGVYGVSCRERPLRVVVYLSSGGPIPALVPSSVLGIPVMVERLERHPGAVASSPEFSPR